MFNISVFLFLFYYETTLEGYTASAGKLFEHTQIDKLDKSVHCVHR